VLDETERMETEDDRSEYNEDIAPWYLYTRHGDTTTRFSRVTGVAEGHDACFDGITAAAKTTISSLFL
jgi:hypothetical protein